MSDNVKKPGHYQLPDGTEVIDHIRSALTPEEFRGYLKGNQLKYLFRDGRKTEGDEDWRKAGEYNSFLFREYNNQQAADLDHGETWKDNEDRLWVYDSLDKVWHVYSSQGEFIELRKSPSFDMAPYSQAELPWEVE